ncbi:peptidoglycan-binding domain-containing protein [Microseira wollei]|uniref:peptidoglycan-binding domain-containing protein n=1 Tax=Microseira wollei TaxID=467598 RepID=UPI0035A24262
MPGAFAAKPTIFQRNRFNRAPIDRVFGSRTRQALIAFQRQRGLLANGIASANTWNALRR